MKLKKIKLDKNKITFNNNKNITVVFFRIFSIN